MKVQYKNIWYSFYIDTKDYKRVSEKHWRASHKKNKVYAVSGSKTKKNTEYLHNFILNHTYVSGYEVDHIDGNSFNNRTANLRVVTRLQNIQNAKARIDNKIGVRGISYNKNWHSYIVDFSFNKRRYYFPHWKTLKEAIYCRKIAEEYFGLEMLLRNPIAQKELTLNKKEEGYLYETVVKILRK